MGLQEVVIGAGVIFGAVTLSSVCWVWVKKTSFGTGGLVLTFAAVVLMGLSVWSSARLKISGDEIEVSWEKLVQNDQLIAQGILDLAGGLQTERQEVLRLAGALEDRGILSAESAEGVRRSLSLHPKLDVSALQKLAERPR